MLTFFAQEQAIDADQHWMLDLTSLKALFKVLRVHKADAHEALRAESSLLQPGRCKQCKQVARKDSWRDWTR